MKLGDVILLIVLVAGLGVGLYFFFYYLPIGTPIEYKEFRANINNYANISLTSQQFYPNMRYRNKQISYSIERRCDQEREADMEKAFSVLSAETSLEFYPSNTNPEIIILCSEIAPTPEEKDHFVAGEGGPSEIINTSILSVIMLGKISLYRADDCNEPKVALHELLHALGFDHNNNPGSIMYPVTNCKQEIDQSIIDDLNRLYGILSLPDLVIDKIDANKTSKYINFEISIANLGLKDSSGSKLELYSGDEIVKEFDLGGIELGRKKILTVSNLFLGGNSNNLKFVVVTSESEISKENNVADISVN
ncbi:matrixin family metalloprotease [Candidatus Pacearchaeota archaeon]|nr:matrixin family metalloprotease [Candidatus Pacearchaeota archaeon]